MPEEAATRDPTDAPTDSLFDDDKNEERSPVKEKHDDEDTEETEPENPADEKIDGSSSNLEMDQANERACIEDSPEKKAQNAGYMCCGIAM